MNTSPPDVPQEENDSNNTAAANLETMGGRVEYAIYAAGLKKGEVARILDVARQTVTRWVSGDDIPEDKLERIALVTGFSKSWLRYKLEMAPQAAGDRYEEGFQEARRRAERLAEELAEQIRKMPPQK